jgi:hypothetical protein
MEVENAPRIASGLPRDGTLRDLIVGDNGIHASEQPTRWKGLVLDV